MPVYAFSCAGCGEFDVTRPMDQAAAPAPCPMCGTEARRRFTAPGLTLLRRPARSALEREEKSAYEPAVVGEKRGRPLGHRHSPTPPWVLSH